MGRKKKVTIPPKFWLVVCSILCVALIVLSFKYQDEFAPYKTSVGNVFLPMQKGINRIGTFFSSKIKLVTTMQRLIDENEGLKGQIDALSHENKVLQQERNELDDLRELYKLNDKYSNYEMVAARVYDRDALNWRYRFKIDKGLDDGLQKDMNVIAPDGLVGVIIEVANTYSVVRPIIDDDSEVSAMFTKTSDNCVVAGNLEMAGDGLIQVLNIDKDAAVEDGYEVVTSHISKKFLPGILIGYVSDIALDASGMVKTAKLAPVVDVDKLKNVLVITQLKETEVEVEGSDETAD